MSESVVKPLPSKIDRFSSLASDAQLMKLDYELLKVPTSAPTDLRIVALFQNKSDLFLYVFLPIKGQSLVDIILNGKLHHVIIIEQQGALHKYVIKAIAKNGKYRVTQYGVQDALFIRTTIQVEEEHIIKLINGSYYYDSKRYHQVHVLGELFQDIIDLSTVGSTLKDFIGRAWLYDDIKDIESKKIKLAFVAFNLFDQKLGHYFVPEDIVEVKVGYVEDRHVYNEKKIPLKTEDEGTFVDISRLGQHFVSTRTQTIDKEEVQLSGGKQSEWFPILNFFRYKEYLYHTIYKISDTVKDHKKGMAKYTYAMVIGPAKGYRYARERLITKGWRGQSVSYDYDETTLTEIKVFEVTYQEKGKSYKIPVSSAIYESQKKARYVTFRNQLKVFAKQVGKVMTSPIRWSKRLAGWGWQLLLAIGRLFKWLIKHWKFTLGMLIVVLLGSIVAYWVLVLT